MPAKSQVHCEGGGVSGLPDDEGDFLPPDDESNFGVFGEGIFDDDEDEGEDGDCGFHPKNSSMPFGGFQFFWFLGKLLPPSPPLLKTRPKFRFGVNKFQEDENIFPAALLMRIELLLFMVNLCRALMCFCRM